MGYGLAWFHNATALACADYHGPYVCNAPRGRPIARLFIALLILMLLTAAIIILYNTKSETSTERHFGKEYLEDMYHSYDKQNQNFSNLVCSCQNTAFRWTNFTDFYMMKKDADIFDLKLITVEIVKELCESMNWSSNEACETLLQFCCGIESFTILETTLLLHPHIFSGVFGRSLQSVCTTQERYYFLLLQITDKWKVDKPRLEILSRSLLSMAKAYVMDPVNKSNEYFWEFPFEKYQGQYTMATNRSIAFKMEVSWDKYMHICNPLYCDEVRQVSKGSRMLQSLAEVGGFSSILFILVRGFVWPLFMYLCSWKHEDPLNTVYSLRRTTEPRASSSYRRFFSTLS